MLGLGCEWIASKAQSAWRSVTSSRAWNATARYGRWEGGSAGSAGTPVRPGAIADPPNTRSPSTCETGGAGGTDDLRPRSGLRVGTGGCCRCRPLGVGAHLLRGRLAAEGKSDAVWPLGSDWNRNRGCPGDKRLRSEGLQKESWRSAQALSRSVTQRPVVSWRLGHQIGVEVGHPPCGDRCSHSVSSGVEPGSVAGGEFFVGSSAEFADPCRPHAQVRVGLGQGQDLGPSPPRI